MCSAPKVEPQAIQQPATIADATVQEARTTSDRNTRAAAGSQSTILSSLLAAPATLGKQLMGQ